jgi:chromosome segregation ATPase
MSERREPTISTLPLDKDETARARGPVATSAKPAPPPPVSARPVVVRSPLGPLALLLALAAVCFAGYVFWQLQQAQQSMKVTAASLSAAEARVTELEQRLSLSDDESTQSITVLQANIKENTAEIRKLWGVTNDRNRKSIEQLEAKAAALEKSLGGVDDKIKTGLGAVTGELTGELKVLSDLVEAHQTSIQSADQAVKSQAQSLAAANKKLEQLEQLDAELRKKVEAHEEAIKAVDAFRLQVNRELLKLKGG